MGDNTMTCIDILLAIILPPLGVFLKFNCQILCSFNVYFVFWENKTGGVLDLCFADSLWVATWYHLCYLGPHQVIIIWWIFEDHIITTSLMDGVILSLFTKKNHKWGQNSCHISIIIKVASDKRWCYV
uniref:Uncharacterized protein n=1 Tax=Solanum lycopersicum TaxID=4081 RepID=A0A3Q7EP49_SOLLC